MMKIVKRLVRITFNKIGLDIVRISESPKRSLLGLRNLSIMTIIDVGANTGQFAKYVSALFPQALIYCFEPLPEPYEKLRQWAVDKANSKVKTYNLALGDEESESEIFLHVEHNSSSSFLKTTKLCESFYPFTQKEKHIHVKMTTLDNWMKNLSGHLTPEVLIKLDVQGYEDRVILGGQETFKLAKACILEICLDKLYENQATFKKLFLLLDGLGYHYVGNLDQAYAYNGHVIFVDAVFIK